MASTVLFTPFSSSGHLDALNRRISMMLNRVGFFDSLDEGSRVAVKVHPGERNNITYLRPSVVSSCVRQLRKRGFDPFVTESTTLYCRERFTPGELIETARFNGYSTESLGCPFLVADSGGDVTVAPPVVDEPVGVASEIAGSDALLVMSHVTGHGWTAGLAGSIKQLAMGCTGRSTKARIHLATAITVDADLCNACETCVDVCKSGGIELLGETAVLNDRCVRCGVCTGYCPRGAIRAEHDYDGFAMGCARAARGVTSLFDSGRMVYVNFLTDVTPHCDCEDFSAEPIFPDIGVLVSTDPVAVDQASADLLNSAEPQPGTIAADPSVAGAPDRLLVMFGIEWWRQLDHAQGFGVGSRSYDLEKVTK